MARAGSHQPWEALVAFCGKTRAASCSHTGYTSRVSYTNRRFSPMLADAILTKASEARATPEQIKVLEARIHAIDPVDLTLVANAARVAEELSIGAEWSWLSKSRFTFIDLFAGIGGMRLAAESEGGRCVGSVEINKQCSQTYMDNFGDDPTGDMTTIDPSTIDRHDLLLAGFPCQAFSIAGLRGGFEDTRGTLFRNVAEIIAAKQPDAFILENVKGLVSHDQKRTLQVILNTLVSEPLGYYLPQPHEPGRLQGEGWKVLNALHFGVPQNRERIFIVGFKDLRAAERFQFPNPGIEGRNGVSLQDVLEDGPRWRTPVHARHFLSNTYLQGLTRHRDHHRSLGQGFGFEVRDPNGYANALVGGGMGRERNLVVAQLPPVAGSLEQVKTTRNDQNLRRMTPREWARLQGFPEWFQPHATDTNAYKQFANSVAIPNVAAVIRAVRAAVEDAPSGAREGRIPPRQLRIGPLGT